MKQAGVSDIFSSVTNRFNWKLNTLLLQYPCSCVNILSSDACPPSARRGMGLFERTHLSDQFSSVLYRGPSRGLRCTGPVESTTFSSSRPAERVACSGGVDVDLRRVPCRPFIFTSLTRAMSISFQSAHSDCCRKSRTPPFPQTTGLNQIPTTRATTKSPFRGCPIVKSKAS